MTESINLLITGASGLLGRSVVSEGNRRGYKVTGLAFSRIGQNLLKCDLTAAGEFEAVMDKVCPQVVVHAAAQRFPDQVEKDFESARKLNIETSGRLAHACKSVGCRFIYLSTDYVFDGKSPPYKVTDKPNPLNKYGITKYEGEKAVLASNPDACILRVPVLYGDVEFLGESAVTVLMDAIKSKETKLISHTQRRYPSHTQDIANILCDLSEKLLQDAGLKGILQWCGKECLTKYDMSLIIAKSFSLPFDHLKPDLVPSTDVTRPDDCLLDTSRLLDLGIDHHTPFSEGVAKCMEKWA